jgi:integrase
MVDSRRTGFAEGGRSFYETLAEALATAEEIARIKENEGARGFAVLSPEERADASEAIAILAEAGYATSSLVDAARRTVGELEAERKRAIGPTVKEAVAAYLAAKEAEKERGELSQLSMIELRSKVGKVRDWFGEKRLSEIDAPMVDQFLAQLDLAPHGKKNVLTKLNQLLNWSVRQKWIPANPIGEVKVKVRQSEVEILSVGDAEALLRKAEQSESLLPYVCVSLFAGLRPGEAAQLRWEQIDFKGKQIKVLGSTSKTRESRYAPIDATLAAWLRRVQQKAGPIISANFKNDWKTLREGIEWPKDVLRHTYGSYWLALHKSRTDLAEAMGNSLSVIRKHYRKAIPAKTAETFWQLRPKASGQKPTKSETIIQFPTQTEKAVASR